jgi:hypothetical protein
MISESLEEFKSIIVVDTEYVADLEPIRITPPHGKR